MAALCKDKADPCTTRAADSVMTESVRFVRELYRELDIDNPGNIAVTYDGSWMTRGPTPHIGVGTVIKLFTGLVLEYVVLSNFCADCERAPDKNDPAYHSWKESPICQKNTDKKAGEMEVQAALILFEGSLKKYGLRYTTILCDGDCRTYLALLEADVYGYIKIIKEDCINHVEKRRGTNLRTLKSKSGGEGEPWRKRTADRRAHHLVEPVLRLGSIIAQGQCGGDPEGGDGNIPPFDLK